MACTGKEQLGGAEDDQRKIPQSITAKTSVARIEVRISLRKVFMKCFQLGEVQGDDDEVDQLDADERHDDAAHAVDEQVALQDLRRAERAEFHALERERDQQDDDDAR